MRFANPPSRSIRRPGMRIATRLLLAGIGTVLTVGCGPVNAASAISDGTAFLAQAERQGAPKYARYEYHKANAYLDEAKIKNGYGEYEVARRYAQQASELAVEAKKTSIRRRDLELRRLKGKQQFQKRFKDRKRRVRKTKDPKKPKVKRPLKPPSTKRLPVRPPILPPNMQKKKPKPADGAK